MRNEGLEAQEESIGGTVSEKGEQEQLVFQQEGLGNLPLPYAAAPESFEKYEQEVSEKHEHILHGCGP